MRCDALPCALLQRAAWCVIVVCDDVVLLCRVVLWGAVLLFVVL